MARTKEKVLQDLSAKQKAAAAERSARRRAGIRKAVCILSSQELAALPPVKYPPPRAPSETEEDSETEPEEDTFSRPAPDQVIKLSAEACGSGGRFQWRHSRRWCRCLPRGCMGAKEFQGVCEDGSNALLRLAAADAGACLALLQVLFCVGAGGGRAIQAHPDGQRAGAVQAAAGGAAGHGGHWDGPEVLSAPGPSASAEVISTAECPVVAYRQGAADFCAAYGLPSAMHEYGDASGAAAVATCARAASALARRARPLRRRAAQWRALLACGARGASRSAPGKSLRKWLRREAHNSA